jgi:hypothetical protein
MPKTYYDKNNGTKSLIAHGAFLDRGMYHQIFECTGGGRVVNIEHTNGTDTDFNDKIDIFVEVAYPGQPCTKTWNIQERWRDIKYNRYKDLTVTKFNTITNVPAELFAGRADFILYGYYDHRGRQFGDVIMVHFPALVNAYFEGRISGKEQNNGGLKKQDFVGLSFEDLKMEGLIRWSNNPDLVNN